jgi:ABC-type dipeptide/oligopeptide/nickel transport system ATPase component
MASRRPSGAHANRRDVRVLAIVGASGSGKSSLGRAGLLAQLHAGGIEGSKRQFTIPSRADFAAKDSAGSPRRFSSLTTVQRKGAGRRC